MKLSTKFMIAKQTIARGIQMLTIWSAGYACKKDKIPILWLEYATVLEALSMLISSASDNGLPSNWTRPR